MVQAVDEKLMREWLCGEFLLNLKPRERDIIRLRFGIGDDRERTLEECGCLFGVTKERIRQIEKRALSKLRKKKNVYGEYKRC